MLYRIVITRRKTIKRSLYSSKYKVVKTASQFTMLRFEPLLNIRRHLHRNVDSIVCRCSQLHRVCIVLTIYLTSNNSAAVRKTQFINNKSTYSYTIV